MIPNATLDFSKGNHTNASALKETKELQAESLLAMERIRHLTSECETSGATTMDRLGDQRKRLEEGEVATIRLQAEVDKGKKLQNEFSKWAFRFGTNRKAKKQTKKEKKIEAKSKAVVKEEPASTYKRRGPRPKKVPENAPVPDPCDPNRNELFSDHRSREISKAEEKHRLDCNRNELFSNHRSRVRSEATPKDYPAATSAKAAPLTGQDRFDLEEIQTNDEKLDAALDALGDTTANLKMLATAMGREVEDHNERLERIGTNLEKSKWETAQMNKRVDLLSNRKPVKNKNKKRSILRKMAPMARVEPES